MFPLTFSVLLSLLPPPVLPRCGLADDVLLVGVVEEEDAVLVVGVAIGAEEISAVDAQVKALRRLSQVADDDGHWEPRLLKRSSGP